MLHTRPLFIFVLLLLVLAACRDPPDYPNEPVIEFLSLNKTSMVQGFGIEDEVYMTISFTDGDGDLGTNNFQDSTRVYYSDPRYTPPQELSVSIPMVPELGTGNGISGEIIFKVPTSCCIYEGAPSTTCGPLAGFPTDTIVYSIYIYDRKGNKSNVVESAPVVLLCN